jgi:hypothetical protein
VPGGPGHFVACLLEPDARRKLWAELQEGARPREAIAEVGLEETTPGLEETAG